MTVRTEQTEQAEKNQVTVPVKSSTHFKSGKTNQLYSTAFIKTTIFLYSSVTKKVNEQL